jgi:hypothetical protein
MKGYHFPSLMQPTRVNTHHHPAADEYEQVEGNLNKFIFKHAFPLSIEWKNHFTTSCREIYTIYCSSSLKFFRLSWKVRLSQWHSFFFILSPVSSFLLFNANLQILFWFVLSWKQKNFWPKLCESSGEFEVNSTATKFILNLSSSSLNSSNSNPIQNSNDLEATTTKPKEKDVEIKNTN